MENNKVYNFSDFCFSVNSRKYVVLETYLLYLFLSGEIKKDTIFGIIDSSQCLVTNVKPSFFGRSVSKEFFFGEI